MSCCGSSKANIRAELRIYKKENFELRSQLFKNYTSLHALQQELDTCKRETKLLKQHNENLHKDHHQSQKTMRRLVRDKNKYRSKLKSATQQNKIMEHELQNQYLCRQPALPEELSSSDSATSTISYEYD